MTIQLVVALVSGFVAILSVVISVWAARGTAQLQNELEERRRRATKEELAEQVMSRYREPLVQAAFDLQRRIYNIVEQGFLSVYLARGGPAEQAYARTNTLFVIAEYLGWVEVLRRGVQFLDLGSVDRNRNLADRLEAISSTMATDRPDYGPLFRIFRGQQRAIGECMIEPLGEREGLPHLQCIGYAAFAARLARDSDFCAWFEQLAEDIEQYSNQAEGRRRLIAIQHELMKLVDFIDDPPTRFPQKLRKML